MSGNVHRPVYDRCRKCMPKGENFGYGTLLKNTVKLANLQNPVWFKNWKLSSLPKKFGQNGFLASTFFLGVTYRNSNNNTNAGNATSCGKVSRKSVQKLNLNYNVCLRFTWFGLVPRSVWCSLRRYDSLSYLSAIRR